MINRFDIIPYYLRTDNESGTWVKYEDHLAEVTMLKDVLLRTEERMVEMRKEVLTLVDTLNRRNTNTIEFTIEVNHNN